VKAYLTDHDSPRISIGIKAPKTWTIVDCLIDTGFSSGIALGLSLLPKLQPQKIAEQEFELADGSRIFFNVYVVKIRENGKIRELPAIFTESKDHLVGMEFLLGHRLMIDLKSKPRKILLE
jgi:predicted aspartyl protease